jgi:hypothetical protein
LEDFIGYYYVAGPLQYLFIYSTYIQGLITIVDWLITDQDKKEIPSLKKKETEL